MYFGTKPYDLAAHVKYYGDGSNLYRGVDFAQPRALESGDVLANGYTVFGSHEGYNGGVNVAFFGNIRRRIPALLPIQLQGERPGVLPLDLQIGHILVTGDVVLSVSEAKGSVDYHFDQEEVEIHITGGLDGHSFGIPADLPVAVLDEMYPPSTDTLIGAYTVAQALRMTDEARINLSQL